MGLDQYIYEVNPDVDLTEDYYEHLGEKVEDEDGCVYYDESGILSDILYLRKVNFVQGYMDRLCQEKVGHELGNCEYLIFDDGDLKKFLDVCNEVLECRSESVALDLLPPERGCFYGSYEIDECYWYDLEEVVKELSGYVGCDDRKYAYYAWW